MTDNKSTFKYWESELSSITPELWPFDSAFMLDLFIDEEINSIKQLFSNAIARGSKEKQKIIEDRIKEHKDDE